MSYINIGKIDKSLIVILVGCIFCFLNRLLNQYDSPLYKNHVLTNICISLSRFLTVIPFIILKIRSRRRSTKKKEDENKSIGKIKLIYTNTLKETIRGKWRFILLTVLIYIIQSIFLVYSFDVKTNSWICYILLASIFYYLIFKIKLYKHHYLSIVLILLIGIIIDLITENLQNDIINNPIFLIIKYMKEISFSLHIVIAKYVMERKFISVYELSFYIGLISLIILIIFAIFDYYFFKLNEYKEYFNKFDVIELFVILGVIFTQLVLNLTTLFTTKNNSPCHVFIIYVFGQFAYYLDFKVINILVIICLIIIFFFALIFNEIIEINILGLSYNTKRNIMIRAREEFLTKSAINEEQNENDERKDTICTLELM